MFSGLISRFNGVISFQIQESTFWGWTTNGSPLHASLSHPGEKLDVAAAHHFPSGLSVTFVRLRVPVRQENRSWPGRRMWLIALAAVLQCVSGYDVDVKKLEGMARARVEVRSFLHPMTSRDGLFRVYSNHICMGAKLSEGMHLFFPHIICQCCAHARGLLKEIEHL